MKKKLISITIDESLHKKAMRYVKKYTFVGLSTQISILLDEWIKKLDKENEK